MIAPTPFFIDGNKRLAFQAMMTFLRVNEIWFALPPPAATAIILALDAGEVGEEGLAHWVRDNWPV